MSTRSLCGDRLELRSARAASGVAPQVPRAGSVLRAGVVVPALACVCALPAHGGPPQLAFEYIPPVAPGDGVVATALGAGGDAVVGGTGARLLSWSPGSGSIEYVGPVGTTLLLPLDMTPDGELAVGFLLRAAGQSPFLWSRQAGVVPIVGIIPGGDASASAVSADGTTVVGTGVNNSAEFHAFRWTASSGAVDLGTLPGGTFSHAHDVSADGSVVIGSATDASGATIGFRWTAASGMVPLVTTPTACPRYSCEGATAISADGRVVVGSQELGAGPQACIWENGQLASVLGPLPGYRYSIFDAVSADGRAAVGTAYSRISPQDPPSCAIYWSEGTGLVGVRDYLLANGVIGVGMPDEMRTGLAISPDGSVIVGNNAFCPWVASCPSVYVSWRARMQGIGDVFCGQAVSNSTSFPSALIALGSADTTLNRFALGFDLLPPNASGLYFATSAAGTAGRPAYSGLVCLGSPMGRSMAFSAGNRGSVLLPVDLGGAPGPLGPRVVQPGETWSFQAIHSDLAAGMGIAYFTNAVRVTFH